MDWVDIRLGDACTKIGSGATPRGGGSVYLDAGPIAFIRSQNVHNEGFSKDGMVYLDEKLAQGLANVQVEELDVLLNITGDSVARACQVIDEVLPARVNQHVAIIRTNQEILWPTYLRYFLISPAMQAHMLGLAAVGATRNALTKAMIESFSIRCPKEVDDQKSIADVLLSFDKKIDLNIRINQTLEAMAQAIFKSWFVDFDPIEAKIAAIREGRDPLRAAMSAISGKQEAELDALPADQYDQLAATAALFPDEMEESEFGAIPRGWAVQRVGAVLELIYGKALKSTDRQDGTVPVYGSGGITGYHNAPLVAHGSIIIGRKGTVGSLYWEDEPFFPIDTTYYVRPLTAPLTFCYYVLQTLGLEKMNTDAAVPGLNRENVYRLELVLPDSAVLQKYDSEVLTLRKAIRANSDSNKALADLRNSLLPKLLSGELSVAEVMMGADA
jgi:type I restriction enzyme S subunit